MTTAILPLNVNALRVNANDRANIVNKFKGRVAQFENMPYQPCETEPSTGQAIVQPLESSASPAEPLEAGIHVHWELPDLYRRGSQPRDGGQPEFPHAPNTWLVFRYLTVWDESTGAYGALQTKGWIVESDYISDALQPDDQGVLRPAIAVPLPTNPTPGTRPYKYMGRVVDYEGWTGPGAAEDYLPHYAPNYLTSIGFVGPAFSSFYPECRSVFGFWDHFADVPAVYDAIQQNTPLKFKVSYQVLGWVRDGEQDPLNGFEAQVVEAYDDYVRASAREKTPVVQTPADTLVRLARQTHRLAVNVEDVIYTVGPDHQLSSIDAPERALCAGLLQEVVWDMLVQPGSTYFLTNPEGTQPNPIWTDNGIKAAVGNTTVEGLSALIKADLNSTNATQAQLSDYEFLLDALQLGLLHDLEQTGNSLMTLEETLHTRAFSKVFGGYVWTVENKGASRTAGGQTSAPDADQEVTLPLAVAELLHTLNAAQKTYDQGRAALDQMRKQLFMDWLRFIRIFVSNAPDPNVDLNALIAFIGSGASDSELGYVIEYGTRVGIQTYELDPETAQIIGLTQPSVSGSFAADVWDALQAVTRAVAADPQWEIRAAPADAFWMPTDPVLVMEGDRLEPVRRNGRGPDTPTRLSNELLTLLSITYAGSEIALPAARITAQPTISAATPMQSDAAALVGEAFLLIPMLGGALADALAQDPATQNPAKTQRGDFITSLSSAQGGLSPLEPQVGDGGLFARLHVDGAVPLENPVEQITAPLTIDFAFGNQAATGWTMAAPGWSTQTALPEFDARRVDPFLPVYLLWQGDLDPLRRASGRDYDGTSLTQYFALDPDAIDYEYGMPGGRPVDFTSGTPVNYGGAVVLSRQTTKSLTAQIDQYEQNYPHDPNDASLDQAKAAYSKARIMSQGLGGFNLEQTLRMAVAKVTVEDLVTGGRERITAAINDAATSTPDDDWYRFAFNGEQPIATGLRAQENFGPLRSGFSQIRELEIVDAFGQRMTLQTTDMHPNGAQDVTPSYGLRPDPGDTAHADSIYLPPRILAPSRLWFKWLSAEFDTSVTGFTSDFVEMNAHPATSPVCGWVVPNHLNASLFFYGADGAAIGAFGVEHGALTYRTRAGNLQNPTDDLAADIGPREGPPNPGINPHLFDFMWYVEPKDAVFLDALMQTISGSEGFINPAHFAQNAGLSVLIGRPLAITRAVVALETAGGVLPISQADTTKDDAFPQDVANGRFRYPDRQAASSAALESVRFPVRMGNLADIDDGLVGFLIDGQGPGGTPYGTFYAPAPTSDQSEDVAQPDPDTIQLTLNGTPVALTLLIDPRAPVHATTGILPAMAVEVPPDQYGQAMASLEVTFFTHPILQPAVGLTVPLPEEAGYQWSWVSPGVAEQPDLEPNAGNEFAKYDYTPQTLLEGWLRLSEAPEPENDA